MKSDEELMKEAARGDRSAFETLVRRNQRTAWNVAHGILGDETEARDIAQQAFLNILESADRYKPEASFKTYLCRVVSNLCFDRIRKHQPIYMDTLPPADSKSDTDTPLSTLLKKEQKQMVRRALKTLPTRQRLAVVLQYFEGLSYTRIARVMETSEKAVERLLARARDSLLEQLEGRV